MTNYVPAEWINPTTLPSLKGPAYFAATREDDAPLLVTGGDDPQAIFLSGEHGGRSFRAAQGSSRSGYAITDIEIEIDPSSIVDPTRGRVQKGNVLVGPSGVRIMALARADFGFDDAFAWDIRDGSATENTDGMVAFTRWRIGKRLGTGWVEIAAVAETP